MFRRYNNLFFLVAIHGASALTPLLLFPYAAKTLGSEVFARVVLAEAVSLILIPVVAYSFDLDGLSKAVMIRQSQDPRGALLQMLFEDVLTARIFLLMLGAVLVFCVSFTLNLVNLPLLALWMLVPAAYAIQPGWLFQAFEDNGGLAFMVVGAKLLAVVGVLLLVNEPHDAKLFVAIIGLSHFIPAVLAVGLVLFSYNIHLRLAGVSRTILAIRNGSAIFFGNFAVLLYRDFNVIAMGILGSSEASIAAYSLAEKITKCVQAGVRPLNQFYLPAIVRTAIEFGRPSPLALGVLLKIAKPQLIVVVSVVVFGAVALCAMSNQSALQLLPQQSKVGALLCVMLVAAIIGTANFVLGVAGLNNLNGSAQLARLLCVVGVLNIPASIFLIQYLGDWGAAAAYVGAELLLLCGIVWTYINENRGGENV